MIKVKTILNNCISDIISNNKFNKIFVYGSENLELEKFIFNLTSSPIIGGDVDFCNVLFGKYFSDRKNLDLNEGICKDLKVNNDAILSDIEKVALAIIYKAYKLKQNYRHNKRVFDNVIKNQKILISKTRNQINNIYLQLNEFKECKIEEFVQNIADKDVLIIDNRNHNFINDKIIKLLFNSNFTIIVVSKKAIINLRQIQIIKSQNLNMYSNVNITSKLFSTKANKQTLQKFFDVIVENEIIENVEIKQLTLQQFNTLRQKYLSKHIHYLGTPKVCYGLFANNKLFGVFGLTNDYRNKPPKEIEQPCIYLLSDFVVNSNIKKLSKLVLYCVLSKEVKLLAERLLNKEIKTICTNVFTKNMSSVKYRDLFILHDRKQTQDESYNLTYFSQMGKWNLKEGLKLWKQKL